ncbi:hypothetical protein E2C01_021999 [Portunus trituberculatus]|uniref:Uncharacterized protein n=1 Tax=Portunus trituberculatus TaxID=210409 RepID=A0A5B7E4W1_PORTR|nr:hypothetical protein [Portunus trituberculatus]
MSHHATLHITKQSVLQGDKLESITLYPPVPSTTTSLSTSCIADSSPVSHRPPALSARFPRREHLTQRESLPRATCCRVLSGVARRGGEETGGPVVPSSSINTPLSITLRYTQHYQTGVQSSRDEKSRRGHSLSRTLHDAATRESTTCQIIHVGFCHRYRVTTGRPFTHRPESAHSATTKPHRTSRPTVPKHHCSPRRSALGRCPLHTASYRPKTSG